MRPPDVAILSFTQCPHAMIHSLPQPHDLPPLTVVGAGKLGLAVAGAWKDAGGQIGREISSGQPWTPEGMVFEATAPEAALPHLLRCLEHQVPVVTGTTGWLSHLPQVQQAAEDHNGTLFWSTNFSPAVHATHMIAREATRIMALLDGYEASIQDVHHVHKKDAPSGTALTLQEHVRQAGWTKDLPIESERVGEVVGLHKLSWESDHDCVALQHEAKSRLGFAQGAVMALRWTWARHQGNLPGVYTMTDLF